MGRLTGGDLDRVAWRASLLQATWNYERQQGLGWAWSLEPALRRLYPDAALRRERLAEHTAYFNTQPTLASVVLGAVAGLEEQRSLAAAPSGAPYATVEEAVAETPAVDADGVARVKGVLGSALAAIGDRLFWFTMRPFAACVGLVLALGGSWRGALVMWLCYNALHFWIRWRGVRWGYREGPAVLTSGLKEALEALVRRLGIFGSILAGMLTAMLLVPNGEPRGVTFQVLLVAGLGMGLLTAFRARPTPSQWALGLGAISLVSAWLL